MFDFFESEETDQYCKSCGLFLTSQEAEEGEMCENCTLEEIIQEELWRGVR